jgi:hypothetical protein
VAVMSRTLVEIRENPTAGELRVLRRIESVLTLFGGGWIAWSIIDGHWASALALTFCFLSMIFSPRRHEKHAVEAERSQADRQ